MVEEKQRIEAQREAARQRMVKEGVPELKTPGAAGYLGIKPIWLRTLTANGIITGYINDGYGWIEKTGPGYRGDEVFYYQSDLDAYRTSHPIRPETPIGEREEPSSLSETDRERIVEAAEKLYQETGGENGGYVTRTLVGKILREKKYKHRHDKIKYVCDQLGYPLPPNRSNWARRRESQINKRNPPRWREGEEAKIMEIGGRMLKERGSVNFRELLETMRQWYIYNAPHYRYIRFIIEREGWPQADLPQKAGE